MGTPVAVTPTFNIESRAHLRPDNMRTLHPNDSVLHLPTGSTGRVIEVEEDGKVKIMVDIATPGFPAAVQWVERAHLLPWREVWKASLESVGSSLDDIV